MQKKMTFSDVVKLLGIRWREAEYYINDTQDIYLDFPINPNDFLSFAEKDIANANEIHALVNCLTNAKRAVDAQVNRVLSVLGFSYKHLSFHKRFAILRDIGIVAPRIIQKMIIARNLLEHEYTCPKRQDVEDALDISTLFVQAVDRIFLLFPLEVYQFFSLKSPVISFVHLRQRAFIAFQFLIYIDGYEKSLQKDKRICGAVNLF